MAPQSQLPEPIKPLSPSVAASLLDIEPSVDESGLRIYPCEAVLDDGSIHPRVYLVEAASYIRSWGVWPWQDRAKSWIPAERIASIRSSPHRLPPKFANQLNVAGESGMGYCAFSIKLKDRRRLYYVTGNAVDFLNLPPGVQPADIISVHPGDRSPEHQDRAPYETESPAPYAWSPFRPG